MSKPETLRDLLVIGDVTEGDLRKVAAALWEEHKVASDALPSPYTVELPAFDSLPSHVQDFIVKGLLPGKVSPELRVKVRRNQKQRALEDEYDIGVEPPTVDNEVI